MIMLLQFLFVVNIAVKHEGPGGVSRILAAESQERRELFWRPNIPDFDDFWDDIRNGWDDNIREVQEFGDNLPGDLKDTFDHLGQGAQRAWCEVEKVGEQGLDALKNLPVDDFVDFFEGVFKDCGGLGKCYKDFTIDGCMPGNHKCVITYGEQCLKFSEEIGVAAGAGVERAAEGEVWNAGAGVSVYGAAWAKFETGTLLELHLDSDPTIKVKMTPPTIDMKAEVGVQFEGNGDFEVEKKIYLSKHPKSVFKRSIMAGPIPIYIEVQAQPVAYISAEGNLDAEGTISYTFEDSFGLKEDIEIEVNLKTFQFTHNFDSISLNIPEFSEDGFKSTVELETEIKLGVKLGVEIAVQLYKAIEFNIVPLVGGEITVNAQANAVANLNGASAAADGTVTFCLVGELDSYLDYTVPRRQAGRRELGSIDIIGSIRTICDEVIGEISGGCLVDRIATDVLDVCKLATDILVNVGFPRTIDMPDLDFLKIPSIDISPDLCFDVDFSVGHSLSWQQASSQGVQVASPSSGMVNRRYARYCVQNWRHDERHRRSRGVAEDICKHRCTQDSSCTGISWEARTQSCILCTGTMSYGQSASWITWDRSVDRQQQFLGQNVVQENAPGVGGWGGDCTCPDGSVYRVGDNDDRCGSLACYGGVSGTCHRRHYGTNNRKVTCAPAVDVPTHNYVVSGLNQFCPFGTSVINNQVECFNAYSLLKHSQGWDGCTSGYCTKSGNWGHVAQCGVHMSYDSSATNGNNQVHFKYNRRDGTSPNERWVRICKTTVNYVGCYRNKDRNRLGGHMYHKTIDECASLSPSGFFGMEHPQGSSDPNEAECLRLSGVPSMEKIADSECAAEVDAAGRRLGNGYTIAVYRRN